MQLKITDLENDTNIAVCACGYLLPKDVVDDDITMPRVVDQETGEKCWCIERKRLCDFDTKLDYSEMTFDGIFAKGQIKTLCDDPEYWKLREYSEQIRKIYEDDGVSFNYFDGDNNVYRFLFCSSRPNISVDVFDRALFYKTYSDKPWISLISVYQIRKRIDNICRLLDEYSGLDKYIEKVYLCGGISEGWNIFYRLIVQLRDGSLYRYSCQKHHPELGKINGKNIYKLFSEKGLTIAGWNMLDKDIDSGCSVYFY